MAKKTLLHCLIIFIFSVVLFSYRLLEVPRGITTDEAAFGYNASLISQTLRDENGRFLPVFVLSMQGRDWRQPVAQYFDVLSFKLFGRSLFNLKLVSVFVASISAVMIYLLGSQLLGKKFGFLALIIFLTTPVIMIHSHLALDNIMPVPFILLWLFGILRFQEKKSLKFLILSGLSLGISFYAHKSMRSAVPIWTVLTLGYLMLNLKKWTRVTLNSYRPIILFIISIAPFFLITPILEYKYAGAVFGNQSLTETSLYDFFYFYISNFDPSFLFIKGDSILHHTTGKHGMFLLVSFPLFVYGIYKSFVTKNVFLIFLVYCFFIGPLFLGFIGSIHRASRLIFLVPLFSIISAYGFFELLKLKTYIIRTGLIILSLLFILNYADFVNYYWFKYADATYHIFYPPEQIDAYKKLDEISKKENLKPFISNSLLDTKGDTGTIEDFSRSVYFINPNSFNEKSILLGSSILLTNSAHIDGLIKIETGVKDYYLYIKR